MGAICERCDRPVRASHDGDPAVCQASIKDTPDEMARAKARCRRVVEHRLARAEGYGRIVDVIESITVSPAFPLAPLVTVHCPAKYLIELDVQVIHRGEVVQIVRPISARYDAAYLTAMVTDLLHQVVLSMLDAAISVATAPVDRVRP